VSHKNAFLQAIQKRDFFTENGALSHSTTGSSLVDYFAKCGTYRNRSEKEVFADISAIWADSPLIALMIIFYVRLITRTTQGFFTSELVQKGQGARDEFRKALRWLAISQPETLYKNLWLVPVVGRWSDLWHDDLIEVLDRSKVYALVQRGLADDTMRGLIAKYLPRIRSKGSVHTPRHTARNDWARGFCEAMEWNDAVYRQFKASPEHSAHLFQRQMSAGLWDALDFSKIPGRALFQMISHQGKDEKTTLDRHALTERYLAWISQQPTAKFTGYVYELFQAANRRLSIAQKYTYDRQFDGLIEQAKRDHGGFQGNVWCALDTSGSMQAEAAPGVTAFEICLSLGIFFSTLNEGAFRDVVVMFDSTSRIKTLKGGFTDKVSQLTSATTAWGSTDFQSVIDEIVRVRQEDPQIPVADFPQTLVVVSDMQFNPVNGGTAQTNYEAAMQKLAAVGLPKIRIVWWWVTGRGRDFPSTLGDEGVTMIGGFDGSVLTLLLGGQPNSPSLGEKEPAKANAFDQMFQALDQEVLRQLRV